MFPDAERKNCTGTSKMGAGKPGRKGKPRSTAPGRQRKGPGLLGRCAVRTRSVDHRNSGPFISRSGNQHRKPPTVIARTNLVERASLLLEIIDGTNHVC